MQAKMQAMEGMTAQVRATCGLRAALRQWGDEASCKAQQGHLACVAAQLTRVSQPTLTEPPLPRARNHSNSKRRW
jgi:hypothetical protein